MSSEFQPLISQKLLTDKKYLSHLHVGDGGMEDGGQGWKAMEDIGLDNVREDMAEDMGQDEGVREDSGEFFNHIVTKKITNK